MPRHAIAADAAPRRVEADAQPPSPASVLAAEIQALAAQGDREAARERFGALVALLQRRALRVAFHYLREAADADDVVQDAFIKVFLHIDDYRRELPFDVWFTRILVNTALDRLKVRQRQQRWLARPADDDEGRPAELIVDHAASAERGLLARERWQQVQRAVAALPDRQRLVFTLSHVDDRSPAEISAVTGLQPATVRVHLFRALRKLRTALGRQQ